MDECTRLLQGADLASPMSVHSETEIEESRELLPKNHIGTESDIVSIEISDTTDLDKNEFHVVHQNDYNVTNDQQSTHLLSSVNGKLEDSIINGSDSSSMEMSGFLSSGVETVVEVQSGSLNGSQTQPKEHIDEAIDANLDTNDAMGGIDTESRKNSEASSCCRKSSLETLSPSRSSMTTASGFSLPLPPGVDPDQTEPKLHYELEAGDEVHLVEPEDEPEATPEVQSDVDPDEVRVEEEVVNPEEGPSGAAVVIAEADALPLLPLFAVCPPGIECLLEAGQVVVHLGNLRQNLIVRPETNHRMEVIDETRRILFHVEEDPKPEGTDRAFQYHIYNKSGSAEVLQVYCPHSNTCVLRGGSWHGFKWCNFQASIFCPVGVVAGFVRRTRTMLIQQFEILNAQEDILLILRGYPSDMEVLTPDFENELGRLSVHGWVGIMHEVRRTAGDYGLTFPMDLDVRVKAVLIGAVFAIHWLYSTRGGRDD